MRFPTSTAFLVLLLLILAIATGYNYMYRPFYSYFSVPEDSELVATDSAELTAEAVERRWSIEQLSVEQKIAQLLLVPFPLEEADVAASTSAELDQIFALQPGGVLVFGSQISAVQARQTLGRITAQFRGDTVPLLIAVDHEGGSVQRFSGDGFSTLPSPRQFCAQPREDRLALLEQSAQELAQIGVNLVLAPVVDVATSSAVLTDRICSGDPEVVAEYAQDYVVSFVNQSIIPVIKHYPGIGSTTKDLHKTFDEQIVLTKDVFPFRAVLDEHPLLGVLSSHMGVLNQIPGLPCSLSADCIDQLRSTHPLVFVVSDSLTMESASFVAETNTYDRSLEDRAIRAVLAGNQLLVFGPELTVDEAIELRDEMVLEYATNPLFAQAVDEAVQRVLDLKEFQIFL